MISAAPAYADFSLAVPCDATGRADPDAEPRVVAFAAPDDLLAARPPFAVMASEPVLDEAVDRSPGLAYALLELATLNDDGLIEPLDLYTYSVRQPLLTADDIDTIREAGWEAWYRRAGLAGRMAESPLHLRIRIEAEPQDNGRAPDRVTIVEEVVSSAGDRVLERDAHEVELDPEPQREALVRGSDGAMAPVHGIEHLRPLAATATGNAGH